MKLASWLKLFFLHSGQRNRRSCRHRTTLRRDLEWHGNQPLPAWVEILETRVLLAATFSGQYTITTAAEDAMSVFAADVDGDGDMDVLSASRIDHKIAWYENDGSQNLLNRFFLNMRLSSPGATGFTSVFSRFHTSETHWPRSHTSSKR